MSNASKTAIGGIATALSVIILMPTALEVLIYALVAMAGMITLFCVIELNKKWAFGVYVAVSILSFILVPNKEAAVLYVAFFGYYPVAKSLMENIKSQTVEYLLKFLLFNCSVVLSYFLLIKVFGFSVERLFGEEMTNIMYGVFLVLFNVMFLVYDFYLSRMYVIYTRLWQKKFHKMFRFK